MSASSSASASFGPIEGSLGMSAVREAVAVAIESVPVPQSFKCPMTLEILKDPVVTVDGQVYERSAIQQWFQRGNATSPLTGNHLPSLVLTPERPLQRAIEEYLNARPELERKQLDLLSLEAIAETLENEILAKDRLILNPQDGDAPPHRDLLSLAQQGDSQRCMELMTHSKFEGINAKDRCGRTALHFAMEQGLATLALAILACDNFSEAFAEAIIDGTSWTALELAVARGHLKLAAAIEAFLAVSNPAASHPSRSKSCSEARARRKRKRSRSIAQVSSSSSSRHTSSSRTRHNPGAADRPRSSGSQASTVRLTESGGADLHQMVDLTCTGCCNPTVADIIKGCYKITGHNHSRPVYRNVSGSITALLYFWDDRDGSTFSGWWFGPGIGGDQVWAYNRSRSQVPPASGWRVPWDGSEDNSLRLVQTLQQPPTQTREEPLRLREASRRPRLMQRAGSSQGPRRYDAGDHSR